MKGKIGRPTNAIKKNYTGIRLSDEEQEMLKKCQEYTNMTKTEVIRSGIKLMWERVKDNVLGNKG